MSERSETAEVEGPKLRALLVPLREELYAIALEYVLEVVPAPTVTVLPTAPQAVRGVFNVRGDIVPLFDTAVLLGESPIDRVAFAIMVDTPDGHAALTATDIPAAADLPTRSAEADAELGRARYVLEDRRIATLFNPVDLLRESGAGR